MADCLPFRSTGFFSDLISDYIEEKQNLKPFYNRFPSVDNFKDQLEEKSKSYTKDYRKGLVEVLNSQYAGLSTSEATQSHINSLSENSAFTVTTGHQLNLFTGPLYFLYKIVSTINLAKQLKERYPDSSFVPVYWMASEDHDFEEINFFNFKHKKFQWEKEAEGAVGHLSTSGLEELAKTIEKEFGKSENAEYLKGLFKVAYLEHETLASATQFLANELFGAYGLVILDADDARLKAMFSRHMKNDLLYHTAFRQTEKQAHKLADLGYNIQVNPREINLFYMHDGIRERIVKQDDDYYVLETELRFSEQEILDLVGEHPERFSPNVVMRPLYQEVILPNLAYIGGGGELAYWLELKSFFEAENITFPMLMLRNSVLLYSDKTAGKLKKLDTPVQDLFLTPEALEAKQTRKNSSIEIDFESQKKHLEKQFEDLFDLANKTDHSFYGAVAAQEKKQKNGLDHLEKRLLKAQKLKLKSENERVLKLQRMLFPNQSLQERTFNFSEIYVDYGEKLIPELLEELDPFQFEFLCLELRIYNTKS
ncbi:bacillithiol biosynthesis cysteine-adding enzyme BshC [Psychroflexus sp. CAK1W]|uniref:bacillithiol biosynthesis cysteine-adding enzyme BshC n=1 Tax=Psychroflexus curvus TaxID=2873595 RepID=UPI001CC91AC0|nr:bacillithiol biosynthesis cysteine-adding enzyme BshC [Psychroflexus curvus]MBZ9628060.1 bacillithiol biosynthesis cysteine-adding enzyme BshC [Psychroflexus curvus]